MQSSTRSLPLIIMLLVVAACSKELTEHNVRKFVDDADHAFLAGHAGDICAMRSEGFKLTSTTFKLAEGHTVADLAEAEALEAESHDRGDRSRGDIVNMNAKEYCLMAVVSRKTYRRDTLTRTSLQITVAPDRKQAVVDAHYVVKEPVYAYGDSALGQRDQVEHQIATLQTETDEESIVTRNDRGQLVFSATKATSKQFRVPKARDSRL
jgi:hypothetical protein